MICGGRGENVDNGGRDSHNNGLLSRVGEGRDSEGRGVRITGGKMTRKNAGIRLG